MRGRVRGWALALTQEKAIVLVRIECSFRALVSLPLTLVQRRPKPSYVDGLHRL